MACKTSIDDDTTFVHAAFVYRPVGRVSVSVDEIPRDTADGATSESAGFVTEACLNEVPVDKIAAPTLHALPGQRGVGASTLDIYQRSIDPTRRPIAPWTNAALAGGWY